MFDIANLSIGVITLLLRIAVVFLLYLFLWQVMRAVSSDLRSGTAAVPVSNNPYGQIVVVSAGMTGIPVGKVFPLSPVMLIGRSVDSDISLNDNFLSLEHARIELRNNVWLIEDLQSTNGTYVNGFEVRSITEINDGDVLRIGRVELKLVTS
jgi:hypothetical protein